MRLGTIAFLLGILIFLQFSDIPHGSWLLLLPVSLVCAVYKPKFRFFCFICCGFLWAMLRAELILLSSLEREIEGKTVTVTGQVLSLPEQRGRGVRFEFYIEDLISEDHKEWPSPGKVRLNWYHSTETIKPGQRWQLSVRLKRPYGFMNPGGFDYEAWLFQHRIRATGYVVNSVNNSYRGSSLNSLINQGRYSLRTSISNILEEVPLQGLIIGLGLGDRSQITPQQRTTLINTGTNHLLAISGLHIGLIAGLVFFLSRWLWSMTGVLPNYMAAPRFAVFAAMSAALIYAALAGFSIPTQRALIMLSVVMWSIFSLRRYTVSNIIVVALLLVLIIDPFAAMAAGFWLSFSAILVITYGMSCRVNINNLWWRWGRVQYLISIGLMPLLVLWFQQYPAAGFLANLVAVPWISLGVVPFVLMGILFSSISLGLGKFCLAFAVYALDLLWPLLEWFAQSDFSLWQQSSPSVWVLVASLAGAAIFLQPRGLPARWIGLVWMLPLIFPYKIKPEKNEFWFTLLDVGQGLSAVIQTRQHTLVYDTGAKFSRYFNAGSAVVLPYLRQQAVDSLDLLIISHGDNDHRGGASNILITYSGTPVLTSVPNKIDHPLVQMCNAGQSWDWDGVRFQMLHPANSSKLNGNDNSCVLKVSNGRQSILLTGDIEQRGEAKLLAGQAQELPVTVIIAPHHGSKTSSTPNFLDIVNPEYVLFPVGYRNRFSFPDQDIIVRYEIRGIKMLDTAQYGAIKLETGSDMVITSYRQINRRFWYTKF